MLTKSFDIGYDPGNSETSTVITTPEGDQHFLTIPSRVGRGSSEDLRRFRDMRATQPPTSSDRESTSCTALNLTALSATLVISR